MSMIQAAERYAELEKSGLSISQISARTGADEEVIRERLQLLSLTPEEQTAVKDNKLSYIQALRLCKHRRHEGRSAAGRGTAAPAGANTGNP